MKILPGLGVYWRDQDTIQVGLDPRVGAIVEGLSRSEQEFVSLLTKEWAQAELDPVAREHGLSSSRLTEILTTLGRAGLLEGSDVPRSREAASRVPAARVPGSREPGSSESNTRATKHVHFDSLDSLSTTIALKLAESGINQLSFDDRRPVQHGDHPLMWPRWDGIARAQAMTTLLRQLSPQVGVLDSDHPDLAVVSGSRLVFPTTTARWMEESVPHLLVWTEEVDTCVGPLVEPHHSTCANCLYEYHVDGDEAWNLLAAQAHAITKLAPTSETRDLAASIAVRSILGLFDGHGNSLHDAQWRVPPLPNFPHLSSAGPHPRCGCASYAAMVGALESALPSPPPAKRPHSHRERPLRPVAEPPPIHRL
ncbi:MAG: hypothetical protein ACTHW1_02390 [Ancrocorticia sp.]|uniref:hypothetical protein n=1 Tax=Ancrocorticia sp. TaxID=2593684 RepID=UPI003F927BCA